ncbi:zonadhesin-like [Trichoplusia ni]|uniref:Zonadhesin-like n=1 Tax=Trichoplusia ni TaxID=7111 RepID=A0A7E5VMG7_TRINI|nr:zonadhesin-like [Trichoplusia ni]
MEVRGLLVLVLIANVFVLVSSSGEENSNSSEVEKSSSGHGRAAFLPPRRRRHTKPRRCRRGSRCGKGEEFSTCIQSIVRPQYCAEEENQGVRSMDPVNASCKKGCVCKVDYLRADNGTCIPKDQCVPKCCNNEVLDTCPGPCDNDYCPKKENENADCIGATVCLKPRCKCAFNHRRDENGKCIPTTSCPPFDCSARPNEEFDACPPLCPTDDCSQASPSGKCPALFGNIGIVLPCNPKCRCIKGYWRNNGTCVPYGQCPGVCPTNERYSECIQGECRALSCTEKDKSIPCPRIKTENCLKGCVCEENYLRAANGTCVPKDQCENNVCPANEEWSECTQGVCRALNCSQRGIQVPCPGIVAGSCIKGCVCKENYLRDDSGACIPADQCYAGVCPNDEEYVACSQALRRLTNCSQRGHYINFDSPEPCEGACVCKEGLLRTNEGLCVPEDKCGNITCFDNEILDNCAKDCNSDYCPFAPDVEDYCYKPEPCQPKCKCRFNYRRSSNGTCIPTRDCPPFDCSDRPNEEYKSCPPLCPTDECSLPRVNGKCPFRIGVTLECNPKCQCKEGYGRVNGTCTPYEQCPDLCPANEEYSSCTQATCQPQNCTDRDTLVPCPGYDKNSCKRGCICKKDDYRNEIGKCVSYKECGGPICPYKNEVFTSKKVGCPPNTCISLVAKFKCDADQKVEPGCVCQSGYLRLNETSPCIPICQCPQMSSSPDCIGKQ